MDDFTYNYSSTLPNRLLSINDAVTGAYSDDIKSQPVGNYQYNSIGQLTKDAQVDYNYTYNLAGNVTAVRKTNGISLASFEYNEAGLRQKKTTYDGS
jgi:YD repeat-containing protein